MSIKNLQRLRPEQIKPENQFLAKTITRICLGTVGCIIKI
jgi:hypothetical protein